MKIVLLEDVDRTGKAGEIVEVSDGYCRNFLLPQKKALIATEGAMKQYEERKRSIAKQQAAKKIEAEELAKKLEGLKIEIKANVGDEGKLFGSITTQDIFRGLEKLGHGIEKKHIDLSQPIREVGVYPVRIRLHPEVEATIQVSVS